MGNKQVPETGKQLLCNETKYTNKLSNSATYDTDTVLERTLKTVS